MAGISTRLAFAAALAWGIQAQAATSVAAGSGGSIVYDATSATMTATSHNALARLRDTGAPPATVAGVATLRIGFAAPLVRTDEVRQTEWTGSGHRYIASFLRGTATSFEYAVDSLPDSNGFATNLLTVKSAPGFSVPFVSLDQLSYYYDFDGGTRVGGATLYNPYHYYFDMAFIGLFPPCNCDVSTAPLGPRITAFTATSGIPDYVQNIYIYSNAFRLHVGKSNYDLWDVTTPSVTVADSFVESGSAEWGPAVPEPASWAMMIAGFGIVGARMRRQRLRLAAAPSQ